MPYPPAAVASDDRSPPALWLVDGFNVLHAGVLRGRDRADWWKAPRRQQLLERVERFDDPAVRIDVVFDGPDDTPGDSADGRVRSVFAASADDWLLARLREEPDDQHQYSPERKVKAASLGA